jgi:hypothetical protein
MSLIRTLFWFSIFAGSTFLFTVLFEHGISNFPDNARKEFELLQGYLSPGSVKRPTDTSDKIIP